jgi:CBS domain containing-hemolysin-like protein
MLLLLIIMNIMMLLEGAEVAGMVMLLLGRVPATGDIVEWHGWRFEIVDMDKHRIDKVLAARAESADSDRDNVASVTAGR